MALLLLGPFCVRAPAAPGDALHARYTALQDQLAHNVYHRPVYLESKEAEDELRGDIYAVVEQPFGIVRQTMERLDNWCDILILHLNVKNVRAVSSATDQSLVVSIGKKHDEPLDKAFPVEFSYRVPVANDAYLRIRLHAESGPLGTKNYQIACESIPLDATRTFIHLSYSYDYGLTARLAMKGYLTTIGSGKVGFSTAEKRSEGEPALIGGVRGVVERNTMRYFLAIDAYLRSLAVPPAARLEARLHNWFAETEEFHRQLHEIDEDEYHEMKRNEIRRQESGARQDRTEAAK